MSIDSNEDSRNERAWGSIRGTFYDGNKEYDSDNFEEEETYSIQKKLFSTMCNDDFSSLWPREIKPEVWGFCRLPVLYSHVCFNLQQHMENPMSKLDVVEVVS